MLRFPLYQAIRIAWLNTVILLACGCGRFDNDRVQGYVEGNYTYVSSPFGGALKSIAVTRGQPAKAGDTLFILEDTVERAEVDAAKRRLEQAKSSLDDTMKPKRPSEIEAMRAQLDQAKAALSLSEKQYQRQQKLMSSGVAAEQELDRARAARDQDREHVQQLKADLDTSQLSARSDQIAAAQANVEALEAALKKTDWELSQKSQFAPIDALVFDTVYRIGEWVPAGRPVVSLLGPGNVIVRAFVPEQRIARLQLGDSLDVIVDGEAQQLNGKVSFISPQAEYTPPVIYSSSNRSKLVFMIELQFEPGIASRLHPGQPVDVKLKS